MDRKEVISQTQGNSEPTSNPTLTVDVIVEILTWLPVLALLRFKTVCKDWKAIIEDDNFIFRHYSRSHPCVCREHQQEYPGFELMIRDIYQCLGICYGMIVEKGIFRRKYRIRNPAIRQNLELPDPHEEVFGALNRMDRKEVISQTQGNSEPTSNPTLTVDVIVEILTWLPVLALLRFKTVCKDWKAIIEDDNFIFRHYSRSHPCVCREHQQEYPGFELMIRDIYQCLGICYGMIVEKGIFRRKYRIRNPAIRQNLELPDPHEEVFGMFLAYVSSPCNFKLISLYDNGREGGNGCQILSLDGSENLAWRALNVPNLHKLGGKILNTKFVYIGAVVHCVIVTESDSDLSRHVLSLDIQNEAFIDIIKLQQDCFNCLVRVEPLKFDGKLAFAEVVKEGLQVYTLEAREGLVKRVILALPFVKENPEMEEDLFIFAIGGSEFWFKWKDYKLFVYDTEVGKITYLRELLLLERYSFPLKPSLFAVKGMAPTKRITPNRFTELPKV